MFSRTFSKMYFKFKVSKIYYSFTDLVNKVKNKILKKSFLSCTRDWTQGLTLASQTLYHLSHAPNSFYALDIFWIEFHIFCRLAFGHAPLITYVFFRAGFTSVYHHWHICWDGISLTFCMGWPWTMIFLIPSSQVVGIIGLHHHVKSPNNSFLIDEIMKWEC
jgi:hypothetical protein